MTITPIMKMDILMIIQMNVQVKLSNNGMSRPLFSPDLHIINRHVNLQRIVEDAPQIDLQGEAQHQVV